MQSFTCRSILDGKCAGDALVETRRVWEFAYTDTLRSKMTHNSAWLRAIRLKGRNTLESGFLRRWQAPVAAFVGAAQSRVCPA